MIGATVTVNTEIGSISINVSSDDVIEIYAKYLSIAETFAPVARKFTSRRADDASVPADAKTLAGRYMTAVNDTRYGNIIEIRFSDTSLAPVKVFPRASVYNKLVAMFNGDLSQVLSVANMQFTIAKNDKGYMNVYAIEESPF